MISDAHSGLTNAIRRMLQSSGCQRCRVNCARNLLQRVPISEAFSEGIADEGMVTATLRSVLAQ